MRCKNCGAEIGKDKVCSFCGSKITYDMQREEELLNKKGCPKCGSSNVQFNRENQGEYIGKKSKQIINRTVGICKDCGHTWYPNIEQEGVKKNNLIWWILGWICFFPIPATILIWRKKNTWNKKIKITATVVLWLFVLIIYWGRSKENSDIVEETTAPTETVISSTVPTEESEPSIYENAQIVDLMNGPKTEKVWKMSIVRANKDECTESAIEDWYFNYVKKNDSCNYHIIVYSDVSNSGIYTGGNGLIEKDVELKPDYGDVYMLGDEKGAIYYTVDEKNNSITILE